MTPTTPASPHYVLVLPGPQSSGAIAVLPVLAAATTRAAPPPPPAHPPAFGTTNLLTAAALALAVIPIARRSLRLAAWYWAFVGGAMAAYVLAWVAVSVNLEPPNLLSGLIFFWCVTFLPII